MLVDNVLHCHVELPYVPQVNFMGKRDHSEKILL